MGRVMTKLIIVIMYDLFFLEKLLSMMVSLVLCIFLVLSIYVSFVH